MTTTKRLIKLAKIKSGEKVTPVFGNGSWKDSIEYYNGYIKLWYNDSINSTKIVKIKINN